MNLHLTIPSIALGSLASLSLILSAFFMWQEIGEVNRKLPDDQQISYFGWYAEKSAKLKREYKRLYPNGKIHLLGNLFQAAGFILFVGALIAGGFFSHWPTR